MTYAEKQRFQSRDKTGLIINKIMFIFFLLYAKTHWFPFVYKKAILCFFFVFLFVY